MFFVSKQQIKIVQCRVVLLNLCLQLVCKLDTNPIDIACRGAGTRFNMHGAETEVLQQHASIARVNS